MADGKAIRGDEDDVAAPPDAADPGESALTSTRGDNGGVPAPPDEATPDGIRVESKGGVKADEEILPSVTGDGENSLAAADSVLITSAEGDPLSPVAPHIVASTRWGVVSSTVGATTC